MSALPLFWREGDVRDALAKGEQRAPVIVALAQQFRVKPLDVLTADAIRPFKLLMLAQPRGLSPEELVAIDAWVRVGGRLLVFADPVLNWPSSYPMGDRRRAPPVTLLDPLFKHWGLDLVIEEGKATGEESGIGQRLALNRPRSCRAQSSDSTGSPPVSTALDTNGCGSQVTLSGNPVVLQSAGYWTSRAKVCVVLDKGLRARCSIGQGTVELVDDADVLDLELGESQTIDNGKAILGLLTRLAREIPESVAQERQSNSEQEKNK